MMIHKQRGYLEGMFESIMLVFILCLVASFVIGLGLGYYLWN